MVKFGDKNSNWKGGNRELKHRYDTIKDRCEKPNHISYKHYGAKGIKCLISKDEFVNWFIKNCNGDHSLTIDRIDSNGHYEISNIRLIPRAENIAKRNKEKPVKYNPKKEKRRIQVRIGDKNFASLNEAGKFFKLSIKGRLKKSGLMPDGTKIEVIYGS